MVDTGHTYVALGVSIDRPSAIHITATMTILPAETCSELVERNNVHLIDVTEKLARNFIHKKTLKYTIALFTERN